MIECDEHLKVVDHGRNRDLDEQGRDRNFQVNDHAGMDTWKWMNMIGMNIWKGMTKLGMITTKSTDRNDKMDVDYHGRDENLEECLEVDVHHSNNISKWMKKAWMHIWKWLTMVGFNIWKWMTKAGQLVYLPG